MRFLRNQPQNSAFPSKPFKIFQRHLALYHVYGINIKLHVNFSNEKKYICIFTQFGHYNIRYLLL